MTMKELKSLADSTAFASMYLFYGDESFLTSFYSKRLCDNVNRTFGMADFNFTEFEGDKVTLSSLADTVEGMPMFAERKCVLLKDFDFASLAVADGDFFVDICENLPDTTVLVLSYSNMIIDTDNAKWKRLLDVFSKKGVLAECSSPSKRELVLWMRKAAEMHDASLDDTTAEYLIEKVGTDMRRLKGEIAKISAYAHGQILSEHIDTVAVKHLEAKVYDMVRAVSRRKFNEAYILLEEMLSAGEDPSMILGAVSGAFGDIYRAKIGMSAGKNSKDIASDLDMKRLEFRIKNAMRDASRFSDEYIYRCIEAVAQADVELKNTRSESNLVFEKLIASIAAAGVKNG